MRELALFAGAGGGILGGHLLGWRTVCAVEIDPFCREVLLRRQVDGCLPRFPIWDDVRTFDGKPWRGFVDVVSGGFPCQPFSSAARGRNVATDLWPEMRRIIGEVQPRFVFAENVQRGPIDAAADDLEQMGYTCPRVPLAASDVGADHPRKRYWLAGHADHDSELVRPFNAEMELLPGKRPNPWAPEPLGIGIPDGVAAGVDIARATGNGQVPLVAAVAWTILRGELN